MLRALAMAEASRERVDVVVEVRSATYTRLIELYSEVAAANYSKVAAEFDTVAGKFTDAAGKGDPEAEGDTSVGEPDSVRSGWLDAAKYGRRARPGVAAAVTIYLRGRLVCVAKPIAAHWLARAFLPRQCALQHHGQMSQFPLF